MGQNMKGSSLKVCAKVGVDSHHPTVISTKANGKRTKQTDTERNTPNSRLTLVNGKTICKMDKVKKNG